MRHRMAVRTAIALLLAAVLAIWLDTSGTLSSFSVAQVANQNNSAQSAYLSITNSQGPCSASASTAVTSCTSTVYPTATSVTGTTQTNQITNAGTFPAASISAKYQANTCGPVQLANSVSGGTNGAMLPRSGTTFAGTGPFTGAGSITLNGSTGYASSVASTTEPFGPAQLLGGTSSYGIGIWFETSTSGATSQVDPLFGFGSNALDTVGTYDRILYVDATGKIGFRATTAGVSNAPAIATGATRYNDGAWHFAYVALTGTSGGLFGGTATGYTAKIYVDGRQVGATATSTTAGLSSYSGYWHVGWSPTTNSATTGQYFAGSLSNFFVDDSGGAPTAAPTTNPTSAPTASFDTSATQQWQLNDSGMTTLPVATALPTGATDPCTYVDIAWSLTAPAATVTANRTLRSFVSAGVQTVTNASPAPGATQTSTITLKRDSTFLPYAVGLIIYAPIQSTYTAGPWSVSFLWNAPAAGTVAGSTFVIA